MTPAQWEGRSCAAFSCVFFGFRFLFESRHFVSPFSKLKPQDSKKTHLPSTSSLSLSLCPSKTHTKKSLIGPKVDYAVGYQQFSTALPSPTPIANALLTPLRGAGAKLLEKVGALAAKKFARGPVGGVVGGGGAATSTTAAVDGAQQG